MFVYGCNRVFRYLSLFNRTCIYYNLSDILKSLNLTLDEFKMLCIISGTDYNVDTNDFTIYETIKLYRKYKKQDTSVMFIKWLESNNNIKISDSFNQIESLFNISELSNEETINKIVINNNPIQRNIVEDIMKKYNFIFV